MDLINESGKKVKQEIVEKNKEHKTTKKKNKTKKNKAEAKNFQLDSLIDPKNKEVSVRF